MSCYENILEVLHKSPPDLPTLHLLAPFLASAFVRIPPPARGPMAFKKFWDDTYKGSNISFSVGDAQMYPPEIRGCLKAFHEVFGGDPPTGITFGSSQTTTVGIRVLSCARKYLQSLLRISPPLPGLVLLHPFYEERFPPYSRKG
jgi:hypothetical protein